MKRKSMKIGLSVFLLLLIFIGCGPKINKAQLDDEAYFEYAKSLFDRGKYLNAITEFTVIVLKFSGSPVVDDAQFYLAESNFKLGDYLIAISEYEKLMNSYPESPYVEEAFYKIGLCYMKLSQRPELDQEYTYQALRYFQNFIEGYSDSKFRKEAEENIFKLRTKLARKQLLGGDIYRKMGIYESAIIYYDILLERYYDTPVAEKALFWKAECQYKLKKYDESMSNFSAFIEKYPESKLVVRAKERISELQTKINKQNMTRAEADK